MCLLLTVLYHYTMFYKHRESYFNLHESWSMITIMNESASFMLNVNTCVLVGTIFSAIRGAYYAYLI